jgi:hypothetical protein
MAVGTVKKKLKRRIKMDGNKAAQLILKGMISEFPKEMQDRVEICRKQIKETVESDAEAGRIALALVGFEYSTEDN